MFYPIFIHKDKASDFGASSPDFPGCISAGATAAMAVENFREALALHCEGLVEDGEEMPIPSPLDQAQKHPDAKGATVVLLDLNLEGYARHKRINITLAETLLIQADALASRRHIPRSTLIAQALRHELAMA